jgi:hypothetical protein
MKFCDFFFVEKYNNTIHIFKGQIANMHSRQKMVAKNY